MTNLYNEKMINCKQRLWGFSFNLGISIKKAPPLLRPFALIEI